MIKDDLYSVVPFLIEQVSKKARRYSQRAFDEKGLGITIDQWVLLKIIEKHEDISQRELADISMRDGASITRSLDLLEKSDLITRESIPGNRRQYRVTLKEKGANFIRENMSLINEHRVQLVNGLSDSEIEQLKTFLIRMTKNVT